MRSQTASLTASLILILLLSAGCVSPWWNSFLDPSQVGNFRNHTVTEIQHTIGFCDTPPGVPGAGDPTPDDLIQPVEEYQISVGDSLSIRMLDFLMRDVESEFTPTVDELGYIILPQLGWIHVEGMTVRELRNELVARAKDAGIYRRESEPAVIVSLINQQGRIYHISGSVSAPGRYRIIPPDFRLREAINQAGGLDPSVKTIYVFRNEPKPKLILERGVHPGPATQPQEGAPVPPVSPTEGASPSFEPTSLSEQVGGPSPAAVPAGAPVSRPEQPGADQESEKELIEVVSPPPAPSATGPAATQPATVSPAPPPPPPGTAPAAGSSLPPFVFVNDKFIEAAATQPAAAPGTAQAAPSQTSKPVDWQELTTQRQRIIRIPAEKLSNGDVNYNIVIRNDDWIRLDAGSVGFIYFVGHVNRPGVYSITGQQMSLRQAIAAAGGLDALAWPTRCEVVRRVEGDREETTQWDLARIMDGQDPDIYLKPEDIINVGTHAIAPLLATIRNSFRLTYGFGFVYDRNFADIDSFQGQQNPTDRRRVQLAARFPGLFP